MRITNNNLINSVSNSLQTNLKKLQDLQEKLTSGKNINKPSDDPISIAQLNILKSGKSQHEQFIKTIDNSLSWLEATENNLSGISNTLVSLREICIQAGNSTLNQDGRDALLLQVGQLKYKLLNDANAQYLGNYIFAGLNTTQKPFDEVAGAVIYNGDNDSMTRGISFGSNIDINISGKRIFNMDNVVSNDPNVFQIINSLEQALSSGNVSLIGGEILSQIDRASTNILNLISEVGSKENILELTKQQHENDILNITKNISIKEDIDIADVIIELKKAEMVYSTSLDVAGRIFPPSLLDFLK